MERYGPYEGAHLLSIVHDDSLWPQFHVAFAVVILAFGIEIKVAFPGLDYERFGTHTPVFELVHQTESLAQKLVDFLFQYAIKAGIVERSGCMIFHKGRNILNRYFDLAQMPGFVNPSPNGIL